MQLASKFRTVMTGAMLVLGAITTSPRLAHATLDCDDPDNAEYCGEAPRQNCCTGGDGKTCCTSGSWCEASKNGCYAS